MCGRNSDGKWRGDGQPKRCSHTPESMLDSVNDKLADGRSLRIITVVDHFTRECVGLTADRSMMGMKVAQNAGRAQQERSESITVNNGSEFSGHALEAWAMSHEVRLCFIRLGRPVENGFIESFNGRLPAFAALHQGKLVHCWGAHSRVA